MKRSSIILVMVVLLVVSVIQRTDGQNMASDSEIIDLTDGVKGKGKELFMCSNEDILFLSHQFRIDLYDENGTKIGRSSDIYAYVYDGENWSDRYVLTEMSEDTSGHGVHAPRACIFKDKVYVVWESTEKSLKNEGHGSDYDILMRIYYIKEKKWEPPLDSLPMVISRDAGDRYADVECHPIVYNNKIYFFWLSMVINEEGVGVGNRDIYYRTYDGEKWSDIKKTFDMEEKHIFTGMALKVFDNKIHMVFQSNDSGCVDLYYSSFDGNKWSTLKIVNPTKNMDRRNVAPKLAVYNNNLYCVWMSYDIYLSGKGDYDIAYSVYNNGKWEYPEVLSRGGDEGDDRYPTVAVLKDRLYVFWESNDDVTTDDRDMDIVMRYYNGKEWSTILQISPIGDNGTILPGKAHQAGDDNAPVCAVFKDALYVCWITYDKNTGHPGGRPAVVVKKVISEEKESIGYLKKTKVEEENVMMTPAFILFVSIGVLICILMGVGMAVRFKTPREKKEK